ncbi:PucR family transcriptional regulator [Amycolatopsis benzoatilytica]|uniref:PucR family transcriptional regulator n=1 Tax=Amycolatopsis benzoatilytica TaxID=346045 RepID=UPI0012B686AC|nr:helix-turn-helix domain-containing protein [Amycolatopsis benzoatilytica]
MTSTAAATLVKVADSVLAELPRLVARLVGEVSAELPALAPDAQVMELLESTVRENLVTALSVLGGTARPVDVGAPPVALEFARRLAQRRVPITAMLRAYRLGQAAFQQEMISRIAREPVQAADVAVAATELSHVAFTYIDKISEEVVEAYQLERDTWLRHRNAARLAKVQAALSGKPIDLAEVEKTLGYALSDRHVGAVLWCGPELDENARLTTLERHAALLAGVLGATPLVVAPDASTVWAWFPTAAVDLDAVSAALAGSPEPVRVALGDPASGLPGFRATHQQARQAEAVAQMTERTQPRAVTAAAQLGPLALVAADPAGVAGWVQSVLGALADDDEAHQRMRETVWAYLSSGSSLMVAAQELHLHKNTIQYRLRKAEQERGRPLAEGRIDVEVALLACRLLGSAVLRAVD